MKGRLCGSNSSPFFSKSASILLLLTYISTVTSTDTPVIGILAQEYTHIPSYVKAYPNYTSYIAASYVKNIEAAGARVVPILIGQDREYYAEILTQINGVVIPGGGTGFDHPNGYADAGRQILHLVDKINEGGVTFPVLGVCLGFELILQVSNNDTDFRKSCKVQQVNLNLKFLPGAKRSSLFSQVPSKYIKKFYQKPLTHNNHIWCITRQDMIKYGLTETWNILTLSKYKSWEFVSTVEHKEYPIVGIQFHPEKNAYEWTESQHNPHSHDDIISARFFSDWFIDKARLNNNSFASRDDLYKSLIQNYPNVMSYPNKLGFEQIYLFK
ncbi:hypothetical protein M8J77_017973 [Diaphorina citri]|nr:hypothetical protein M8J77_017973 [Diaphorina citri]